MNVRKEVYDLVRRKSLGLDIWVTGEFFYGIGFKVYREFASLEAAKNGRINQETIRRKRSDGILFREEK